METSPVSAKRPPDCKRYLYARLRLTSDSRTSECTRFQFGPRRKVHVSAEDDGTVRCNQSGIVSACGPLEERVAPTEQGCSLLVKMLITPGDRWRSDYSSHEHVPGKLSD